MDFWIVLAVWVIVLAVAMGITAIVNLRSDDPHRQACGSFRFWPSWR